MRIRLDSPALVDDLMRALAERSDVVVDRVGTHELEAVLVGSYHDGGEAELDRVVRSWLDDGEAGGRAFRVVR